MSGRAPRRGDKVTEPDTLEWREFRRAEITRLVRVTAENIEDVALWLGLRVIRAHENGEWVTFIEYQTTAHAVGSDETFTHTNRLTIGDWVSSASRFEQPSSVPTISHFVEVTP